MHLGELSCLRFPARLSEERHVGSSFQFQLLGRDYEGLESFKRYRKSFYQMAYDFYFLFIIFIACLKKSLRQIDELVISCIIEHSIVNEIRSV